MLDPLAFAIVNTAFRSTQTDRGQEPRRSRSVRKLWTRVNTRQRVPTLSAAPAAC